VFEKRLTANARRPLPTARETFAAVRGEKKTEISPRAVSAHRRQRSAVRSAYDRWRPVRVREAVFFFFAPFAKRRPSPFAATLRRDCRQTDRPKTPTTTTTTTTTFFSFFPSVLLSVH